MSYYDYVEKLEYYIATRPKEDMYYVKSLYIFEDIICIIPYGHCNWGLDIITGDKIILCSSKSFGHEIWFFDKRRVYNHKHLYGAGMIRWYINLEHDPQFYYRDSKKSEISEIMKNFNWLRDCLKMRKFDQGDCKIFYNR